MCPISRRVGTVGSLVEVMHVTRQEALAAQARADAIRDMLDYFGAESLILM